MMHAMFGFSGKLPFYLVPKGSFLQGQDGNQTSGGSYKRLTGEITIKRPLRLDGVYWDISAAQTYTLQQVDSVAATPTIIKTLADGLALPGSNAKSFIPISPPLYVLPGFLYLSLYCGTAVQQRRNSLQPTNFAIFSHTSIGYDGGSTTTGTIPVKLSGQWWDMRQT